MRQLSSFALRRYSDQCRAFHGYSTASAAAEQALVVLPLQPDAGVTYVRLAGIPPSRTFVGQPALPAAVPLACPEGGSRNRCRQGEGTTDIRPCLTRGRGPSKIFTLLPHWLLDFPPAPGRETVCSPASCATVRHGPGPERKRRAGRTERPRRVGHRAGRNTVGISRSVRPLAAVASVAVLCAVTPASAAVADDAGAAITFDSITSDAVGDGTVSAGQTIAGKAEVTVTVQADPGDEPTTVVVSITGSNQYLGSGTVKQTFSVGPGDCLPSCTLHAALDTDAPQQFGGPANGVDAPLINDGSNTVHVEVNSPRPRT